MKILVPCKRVSDPDQPIQLDASGMAVDLEGVTCVMNPFDAIALEEALRVREEDRAGPEAVEVEVVAVSIGGADCEKELRVALAMGADRAILVDAGGVGVDPWGAAEVLVALVGREQPDLVLMGKQAVDDDSNQTGQLLAALAFLAAGDVCFQA